MSQIVVTFSEYLNLSKLSIIFQVMWSGHQIVSQILNSPQQYFSVLRIIFLNCSNLRKFEQLKLKQNVENFIIFENVIVKNEKILHCALQRADYYYVLPDDDPL